MMIDFKKFSQIRSRMERGYYDHLIVRMKFRDEVFRTVFWFERHAHYDHDDLDKLEEKERRKIFNESGGKTITDFMPKRLVTNDRRYFDSITEEFTHLINKTIIESK